MCRGTRTLIDTELREGRLVEAGAPHWAIDVEIRLFRRQASELPVAEALWNAAGSDPDPAPGR